MEQKKPSKADLEKKVEAWKTLNKVLVETHEDFMQKLVKIMKEKESEHASLRESLEKGNGTEEDNAKFLYIGGYIQAFKDILGIRNGNN